ncbi:MAG: hypothetical protein IJ990_08665, partial [Alistipes sp.]|nr:hypothetical protein [Alistipes sp.]
VYMGEWTLVALNTGYKEMTIKTDLPATLDGSQPWVAHFGNDFQLEEGRVTLTVAPTSFEIITKNNQ